MLAHPFHLVAELSGVLPFIVFLSNYDHDWHSRTIDLNLSTTEVAVNLSPDLLHTALLHFDDYTDAMSPFNEWLGWLRKKHSQTLNTTETEREVYRNSYARMKGANIGARGGKEQGDEAPVDRSKIEDIERRMTWYEIMSLRCHALKEIWRIPKANEELESFLRSTRSSILHTEESNATNVRAPTSFEQIFEQAYPTPQHALVAMMRANSELLAANLIVKSSAQILHIDLPGSRETSAMPSVASSVAVTEVSFDIALKNILAVADKSVVDLDSPRPYLDLSLQMHGCKWGIDDTTASPDLELPMHRDRSLVGIVYMSEGALAASKPVLSLDLVISVAPTLESESHYSLTFNTSQLVIVANPLPLLSSLQNLIDLGDIPSQLPEESTIGSGDLAGASDSAPPSPFGYNVSVAARIDDTHLILLVDRKKVTRGILNMHLVGVSLDVETGDSLGRVSFLTETFQLCAGQIANDQSYTDEYIRFRRMPFLPIASFDGAELLALGKEDQASTFDTSNASSSESNATLRLDIEVKSQPINLNASPSTIVALHGSVVSLDPVLEWLQGEEKARDEELKRQKAQERLERERNSALQRTILQKIFREIDVDKSGYLSEDELDLVVRRLFYENNLKTGDPSHKSIEPTSDEIMRERDYLLSVIDRDRSNEITFQELDSVFYRLANRIDDVNLMPEDDLLVANDTHQFDRVDSFLSAASMRTIVYFDDMREYASVAEVYRITGQAGLEQSSIFPAPSLWRKGEGIELFWDLYCAETGCSRNSLNGQSAVLVQRKLVRVLLNYQFAKFCWKGLVQPELYDEGGAMNWMLDGDWQPRQQCGIIDLLLRHVETEVIKGKNQKSSTSDIHYDIHISLSVDGFAAKVGSSHTFSNPLVEIRFANIKVSAQTLLLSTGWFVPESEPTIGDADDTERQSANQVSFQSRVSAFYLNTKHNHMESLIEPYTCFGGVTYAVFPDVASYSINLDCPRFLNINATRSFFEAASVLMKVISQSDPETFRSLIFDRDMKYFREFWDDKDRTKSGLLSYDEAFEVLNTTVNLHWKDELVGLDEKEKAHFIETFCNLAADEENGIITLDKLTSAFRTYASRCYFSGSEEILLINNVGRAIKISTNSTREHSLSEFDSQQLLGSFLSVERGTAVATPLNRCFSFYTRGYKVVHGVPVSSYQSLMFPLKRQRRSRRRHANASGFSPHLTVVPKADSLDSITLDVRTSVYVNTEIPIRIRIVRLQRMARGRDSKKKKGFDLGKKSLINLMRRKVEGAKIVYEEQSDKNDGFALPLDVIDSSHYHALLIKPLTTGHDRIPCPWRDPVLLTKEFLYNKMNFRAVTRCHALSGIQVKRERLELHLQKKHHRTATESDTKRSILRGTAWDTTINVVPFFRLSNNLPFPIVVRAWQNGSESDDELWDEPLQIDDENSSSDEEDVSFVTPSISYAGRKLTDEVHYSSGGNYDIYSEDKVAIGDTLRLSGISLSEPLFIQVSQDIKASEDDFFWTNPVQIDLSKMKTGINLKGQAKLPTATLGLGDNCDCLVHVSVDGSTSAPECTIFSPFWIVNKTGMKLRCKVAGQGKSYVDSGGGGLPIMVHGGKATDTNHRYSNVSKDISVTPLECPTHGVASNWWDEASNGRLVLQKKFRSKDVGESEHIDLDAAGTCGLVNCGETICLNAKIDSLAGAFHRSNLITFAPRYVVKNMLHIGISILPLWGGKFDAMHKASRVRQHLDHGTQRYTTDLAPGESTILYNFYKITRGIEHPFHWVAFCVNASRYGATYKRKWHLIPVDKLQKQYFGEHDGSMSTMCGIVEARVHSSDTGSILVSLLHSEVPPFRIENRSSTHYLRFVQEDDDAVVFELPPMYKCNYTWDSPLGNEKLRAVVIPKAESREYQLDEALDVERREETLSCDKTVDDTEGVGESISSGTNEEFSGTSPNSRARQLKKTARYRSPRKKAVYTLESRAYTMSEIGKQKDLPCPSAKEMEAGSKAMSSKLLTFLRIDAGTKILSFSDSSHIFDTLQEGTKSKGGSFKRAHCEIRFNGMAIHVMDEFPQELMSVVVRDVELLTPKGSIDFTARVRHFQVDAMLPNARYPIVIAPLPLGVDRRETNPNYYNSRDLTLPLAVEKKDCFWMQNEEKPFPVIELVCSYIPEQNMTWIPSLNVFICPLKVQIDVDYILRVLGMIISSVYKDHSARNLTETNHDERLKFITRGQYANLRKMYIERLHIDSVYFDVELNIKSNDSDDRNDGSDGYSSLTLHSIAQTTNSATVAGLLGWVINVGANFAHVSPTFRYSDETYTDQYCDVFDLLLEVAMPYVVQTVKQAYKVVFSMQLLGDPSQLFHQYKTGVSDLFTKTSSEILARGENGFGRGVASFAQNTFGGTAFFFGKFTGGIADTLDSAVASDMTSNHLKSKSGASSDGKHPDGFVNGVIEGGKFFGQTTVHGIAGLIGDPYRGVKSGTATGVAKGVASGVAGAFAAPFIGALGFMAKTADGAGASTQLTLGVMEARCRPIRTIPWGRPITDIGLNYLKSIGVRIHTVRYQKIRKRLARGGSSKDDDEKNDIEEFKTSKEYKRIKAAEERRKNPPRKVVSIMHEKDKYHYITSPIQPKLLADAPGNLVVNHYSVTFEETIVLRTSDLQLGDHVQINVWNQRGLKSSTTRATSLGMCKLSVGDIYSFILHHHNEELRRKESHLMTQDDCAKSLITPTTQEFALFKTPKIRNPEDIIETIAEEMAAIEKSEKDKFKLFDNSSESESDDSSFLGGAKKKKEEGPSSIVKSNERLYGSVSLSFFPISW